MTAITATEIAVDLLARQDKLARQLNAAGNLVDRSLGSMEARGKVFADRFSGYLAGFAVGALVRELGQLADQSKQLDAQLRLATAGFGSLAKAQEDTRRIATTTRNSLEATTKLYAGFVRASQETGRTQEDAARATQTFSEALKIGGAGAAEAASATLQFNQALQSGTLRGDEFNSIMEASPRVARLLADALGVPIGQLRAMAEQGKITSDVLFRALTDTRFTTGIDAEFKQLPQTFSEAMQAITNASIVTFGAFDKGGQFSNAIVSLLSDGTDTFAGLEKLASDFGVETRAVFEGLGDVFNPLLAGAQSVFGGIRQEANYARDSIANILSGYDKLNNALVDLGNKGLAFDNSIKRGLNRAIDRAGGGQHFEERALTPRSDYAGQFIRGFDASVRRSQARLAADAQAAARTAPTRPRAAPTVSAAPTRGGRRTGASPRASGPRLDPAVFERQEEHLQDRLLRARAEQATTAEDVAAIELQRIENERRGFAERTSADKRITAAQKQQLIALSDLAAATDKAAALKQRDVAIEARTAAALRRENESAEDRNRDEQGLVRSRLDIATTARARLALELRLLQLAQDQEKADQEQLIADRRRIEADPNASPEAKARARSDIRDAQDRLATQPERFANERQGVASRYKGPLAAYRDQLAGATGDMNSALEDVAVGGLKTVEDGLVGLVSGTESVGSAFKKMADGIIADLARIAIQKAIFAALSSIGGFSNGGIIPGFADGGSLGGRIKGPGTGRSDSILAVLSGGKGAVRVSNGEFIVNARSTERHLPLLEAINAGRMPGFADGGRIQPLAMPNLQAAMPNVAARTAPSQIVVHVQANDYFDARVAKVSGPIARDTSVSVVQAAAPQIVGQATSIARREAPSALARYQRMGTVR